MSIWIPLFYFCIFPAFGAVLILWADSKN